MREQRVRVGVPELRFLGFEMHALQIDDLRSLKSVTFFATNPVFFLFSPPSSLLVLLLPFETGLFSVFLFNRGVAHGGAC